MAFQKGTQTAPHGGIMPPQAGISTARNGNSGCAGRRLTVEEAEDENKYFKVLKEYVNPRVLILDEWLLNPITNEEARYVLDLIHKRRKKSSTIFCSQYEDTGWYAQLGGDETPLADSIMDRIAYDSYKINIRAKDPTKDRSMREVYGIRPDERE